MFSNLSQNSILYIFDVNGESKILTGPVERVSPPKPKYNTFNPNMEMVVDITATVNGERREFKGVPNTSIANFGSESFILADSRESMNAYIQSMLQTSRNVLSSMEKHEKLVGVYEKALQELNPSVQSKENEEVIKDLKAQMEEMKSMLRAMVGNQTKKEE